MDKIMDKPLDLEKKNVLKAQIAAEYADADYFKFELSNISKKGPFGEIVLKTPTGSIFGSNAIARYVANGSSLLRSTNKFEFGQVEQWIGFSSVELDPNLRGWALLRLGYFNYSKDAYYKNLDIYLCAFALKLENHYISKLKSTLGSLNAYLASHKFLVGNSVTLADIITTCDLIYGFKFLMTMEFTSKFPNVEMYFWEMIKLQNVEKFTREVKQANDVISLSKAMKQESPLGAKPMRKRYRSARKLEEEAKRENRVDSPSMMVLDNTPDKMDLAYWKKLYPEIKTNMSQTIKGFLDFAADYSLWFCDDKQNDKNELIATVEKVKAFLVGIDLARDHTFGKILITGSNAACKVNGFWIFQQAQVTNILRDRLKESFKMTQVDTSVEDQKKRVIQMIESKDIFEDVKILHVFCFM